MSDHPLDIIAFEVNQLRNSIAHLTSTVIDLRIELGGLEVSEEDRQLYEESIAENQRVITQKNAEITKYLELVQHAQCLEDGDGEDHKDEDGDVKETFSLDLLSSLTAAAVAPPASSSSSVTYSSSRAATTAVASDSTPLPTSSLPVVDDDDGLFL